MIRIKFGDNLFLLHLLPSLLLTLTLSCGGERKPSEGTSLMDKIESVFETEAPDDYQPANTLLLLPAQPAPGEGFRILATGGRNIRKAKILVTGPNGNLVSTGIKTGDELPCWRLDDFSGESEGSYKAVLVVDNKEVSSLEFTVSKREEISPRGLVWKTLRGWDIYAETLYAAWINALFQGSDEQTSWKALHEVTENKERNFLYNHLSLNEDDPAGKIKVIMEPDCADNPFFLRAYFAWKLGLPFGYHICDRGYLGKNPGTGQWITNDNPTSKSNPIQAFNSFLRRLMDGVHSGTARTSLDNENADYYPVSLDKPSLRPGIVFADPYGHTFILVSWKAQTKNQPGVLLAVDAQPDKTIAIKRFWKGNFLFNTSEVVGEPGFKAFRPILFENGKIRLAKNAELIPESGFIPFSLQQRAMESDLFYRTMDRVINPEPLEAEAALDNLIKALHEQLLVRVKSVANGEEWLKAHPGSVIPMPSNARGIFLTSGLWEDFSTPNRDLRLLIAMDAVIDFPERVATFPEDFKISTSGNVEETKDKLQALLDKKVAALTITYTRSDGSLQELTLAEVLQRIDAFEMAYNPNDCVEIRWGAPENSAERSTCKRQAPAYQRQNMLSVRKWFNQRLHPPT